MGNYKKTEIKLLKTQMFHCVCNGVSSYQKGYLKENAFQVFKKIDSSIDIEDVSKSSMISSHSSPCDEIIEIDAYEGLFQIVLK
jgi:hypothetical protein